MNLPDVADILHRYIERDPEMGDDVIDAEDLKGTVKDAADNHHCDNLWINPDWADKPMPKNAKMVCWSNGDEPPFYCFDFFMCYDEDTKEILFCVDHRD
jgi:hypothetical protein